MATTHAKPAFRLPWVGDRAGDVPTPDGGGPAVDAGPAMDEADAATVGHGPEEQESENHPMIDAAPSTPIAEAAVDRDGGPDLAEPGAPAAPAAPSAGRVPSAAATPRTANKFLADLTRAMQTAAEAAKADAMERLAADAKSVVESIKAGSVSEASELRKRADDDVAAVREWSKREMARIREETDERIAQRKERLEHEIEAHAARVEARIDRVQQRVAAFEAEMQAFFERLLDEQDPTRFASLAEALPEPPPLDADGEPAGVETTALEAEVTGEPSLAEPSASTEDVAARSASDAGSTADATAMTPAQPVPWGQDPRLARLGLDRDFAAAEAEALAHAADDGGSDESMPEPADDLIAARLAGLVAEPDGTPTETVETRVVVVGLVSVASIAGFKRQLARIAGVRHVGVTSGPEGEFIFTASHDPSVVLREVIPTLPGFAARITADLDGALSVTARDPETEH